MPGVPGDWAFEPAVVAGIGLAALVYWRGLRYSRCHGMAGRLTRGHVVSFAAGLLALGLALESPIDLWSVQYLWVHMVQHVILTMVVAPLLVLGAPALPLLRGVPLGIRRYVLQSAGRQGWVHRTWRGISHPLASPVGAWCLFVGDFAVWHLPPLYDLTLEQAAVHYLEHLLFLVTAILFWAQVIPSRPFVPRWPLTDRAIYLGSVAVVGNALDVIFISVPVPVYSYYAVIPRQPGMMSALVDQSVAAGVMGAANALLLAGALLAWRWSLQPNRQESRVETNRGHTPRGR